MTDNDDERARRWRLALGGAPQGEGTGHRLGGGDAAIDAALAALYDSDISYTDHVMRQLTSEGENEDPAWAPDGRHLSITRRLGAIGDPRSIWILDIQTGRLRQLTLTGDARLSDWSPPLRPTY